MTLLIMDLHSVVWKALCNFKIKNNDETFEIFKIIKNNSWINVSYTKSKRLQSLDCLFCVQLEILFLGKFGPKNQNYFELKFRTRLIQIAELYRKYVVFTFSVLEQKTLLRQIWSKKSKLSVKAENWYPEANLNMLVPNNQNCWFKLKFCTRLI